MWSAGPGARDWSDRPLVPFEAILTLIAIAVLANIVLMGAALSPVIRRWAGDERVDEDPSLPAMPASPESGGAARDATGQRPGIGERLAGLGGTSARARAAAAAALDGSPLPAGAPGAFDRVIRVVAWIFLLSTTVVVAVSGLWREDQSAILVLTALAGLFVLVVHDVLPPQALGAAKFVVEGSVAITFAAVLVLLTGQVESPFFFTFPLIVGGAALVVSPRATLAVAAAASIAYLVAISLNQPDPFPPRAIAVVGINLTALLLLAYVGMVIARENRRAREEAFRLSMVDALTGLHTRAYFFAALDREINRSARTGRRFCLLMMDLDGLKEINDRFGHFHGDRVLRAVGEVIRQSVRRIDTASRYGGDEFVVLLPETDPTGAWVLAEKIRLGVTDIALQAEGERLRTSLSVGVVSHPDDGDTPDALMIQADAAMYSSKRAGKDRVMGVPQEAGAPGGDAVRRRG